MAFEISVLRQAGMRDLASKTKLIAALAVVVLLVVVGIFNLRDRLSIKTIPDDGIRWVDTGDGVQAKQIEPDSPLALLAKKGDYLRGLKTSTATLIKLDWATRPVMLSSTTTMRCRTSTILIGICIISTSR